MRFIKFLAKVFMPSLSSQKLIRKLRQRKYRWQERKFIAEGPKLVEDLIAEGLKPELLFSTQPFLGAAHIDESELKSLSTLSTPNQVLAVFPFPEMLSEQDDPARVLILDGINDPGNLGTLLRTADWFGFSKVICTLGTADVFNAKTTQSTMGSLARLDISYASISEILLQFEEHQFWTADMDGISLSEMKAPSGHKIALVMGSESHGPSAEWQKRAKNITIPRFGTTKIDSLNVGIAGGVLMHQIALLQTSPA
jgi:TrmH family RNA methyltransferase